MTPLDTHLSEDPEFVVDMLIKISGRFMEVGDLQRAQEEIAAIVVASAQCIARINLR